ncbi:DNA cytosine methyltransferase [Terribacillus saccharophilus]|uniref:DNA cytosine methyltransferase n=1 Tax=Terribacillus saccharophilus TaxID=361277 RepID=UPI002989CA3F|nr:DNA (cytosine-5-)-methyltransferase [Terribacillus saccharophilus]MCM3227498.1 DNA (cytosine-5-)-methyltransferase [Terribacillus saccharophilus]
MIKILELFGGIGAPRKAVLNLGISHKAIDYVEIDEKAVRAYNALYENKYSPESVVGYNLKPDILVHGSPCQDYSRSGKRLGGNDEDKTRSSLMWETLKIIENMGKWRPKHLLWENVTGVLDWDMKPTFQKYLDKLSELGYTNSFQILNASDFGVPQKRNRIFVVSSENGYKFNFNNLEKKPMAHINDYLEKGVIDSKYFITIPSMKSRIKELSPNREGKYQRYLDVIEDSCWTISTRQDRCPNAGIIKVGNQYRYLTERECWRLMGFDDSDFDAMLKEYPSRKGQKNATLYKLAGNSIVVDVLEAIFKELFSNEIGAEYQKKIS